MTYVNLSGQAVFDLREHYQLNERDELVVILDDSNLPFGRLRLRMKGGSGGHRGLESIIFNLGTEEFPRLRIGIGRDPSLPLREWVLSPFTEDELRELPGIFERALEGLNILMKMGKGPAMQFLNTEIGLETEA
jgi:PTH1 family peptidyl-tRNA hydrolase